MLHSAFRFCAALAVWILVPAHAPALAKPNASLGEPRAIVVTARRIGSFSKTGLDNGRFGALKFRGGLVLTSTDPAFGGFSGIEISPDGQEMMAVSDAGAWLRARLEYEGLKPSGLTKASMGPILALAARRLNRRRDRDAEAIRLVSGTLTTGTALVAFELNARIGYFRIARGQLKSPVRYLRPPMRLRHNRGIEAVTQLPAGRYSGGVIAFAERDRDSNGHHRGWLWHSGKANSKVGKKSKKRGKLRVHPIAVRDIGGFALTDVTGGPDGSLYLLERRFRWSEGVKMRIRHIPASSIKPGAILDGKTLIAADLGSQIDNMEGIAIHRDARGRLILTLISDNNFNTFLQRTLLLQFEVVG